MGSKGEVGVESDTQDARTFIERNGLTGDCDLRMDAGLSCFVRSEKGDCTLLGGNRQHLRVSPCDSCINIRLETRFQIGDVDRGSAEREVVRVGRLFNRAVRDKEIEEDGAQY